MMWMGKRQIPVGKILTGLLLAAMVGAQAQENKASSTDPGTWATYRNASFGIEFNYPKQWAFHESPGNRVIASFSFTTKAGYQGDFVLSDMRPVRITFDRFLQRHQTQLAKAKRIPIGSEEGFEQDEFLCGGEDPGGPMSCSAWFRFPCRTLFSKGVDVDLSINVPYAQGHKYSVAADPYLLFKDEVDLARHALATLKFIGQNP